MLLCAWVDLVAIVDCYLVICGALCGVLSGLKCRDINSRGWGFKYWSGLNSISRYLSHQEALSIEHEFRFKVTILISNRIGDDESSALICQN